MAASIIQAEARRARRAASSQARAPYAHAQAYDQALMYAHLRAYVSLGLKASGLVALLLSTVILLGGYVQSLGKKDFLCIMAITVIQAAGIFQEWENNLQYLNDVWETFMVFVHDLNPMPRFRSLFVFYTVSAANTVLPFLVLVLCVQLFYFVGPLVCAAISAWRIVKLNHVNNKNDGTDSMADMMVALNTFYSLIIFQGAMFFTLLLYMSIHYAYVARDLHLLEQLSEKWAKDAIRRYISDISAKCRKDPVSIKGLDLIKYAAELLDSESQEDYLYGARLLSTFVKKGEDVRWLLLPSMHRHRIQRLIESLMISSSSSLDESCVQLKSRFCCGRSRCLAITGSLDDKKEIRELAATIVADVAAHIDDLSKFPGAMRCISSLFQDQDRTTQTYGNQNSKQVPDDLSPHLPPIWTLIKHYKDEQMQMLTRKEVGRRKNLMRDQKRMVKKEHRHRNKREGSTSNKLVRQGLTILERLASSSDDNRRIICSTSGLLPKITTPVYSATLLEDIKAKAWADIVTRCLKVLYQLIRAPAGWTSRRLRHEISSDDQALRNLKSILDQGNEAEHKELKLITMEILTELALDLSINLTKETKKVLGTKQLQLFLLANGDDEESAAITGRAMVSLSTNSGSNSDLIMSAQNDIAGRRLTEMLDEADHQELQLVTMGILTELSLDLSVNPTDEIKKVLIKKQLELFLHANGDDEEESATIAGRAMVSLSTKSKRNSALIMTTQDDIIGGLTRILDDVLITRRTIAAEIMENLCAHCNVDNKKEILAKVLREIMSIKRISQDRKPSAGQNNPALGDEEDQGNSVSTNDEESHSNSWKFLPACISAVLQQRPLEIQQSPIEIEEEISDQEREEQEAFLSLAQVICAKLGSADLDGAIQNAVDQSSAGSQEQRREAFVEKLKTIIDDNNNRHATPDYLRIVKLCGRIAKSVMQCEQYVEIFRNKGFKHSLSEASKTMSELESCMLFVGTDFGLNKTVRPLLSEIEESFGQI